MTMVPEMRWCSRCHKRYSWNPDVGRMRCPNCGGIGEETKAGSLLSRILNGSEKTMEEKK